LRGRQTSDHPKEYFVSQRNPINIHTRESPKLDYNIVEDLKKLKKNISVMDMCRIPQQNEFMLQALKSVETLTISTDQGENPSLTDLRNKPTINACSEDKKGNPFVPPFLMLEEEREKEKSKFISHQWIVKRWFDKHHAQEKNFEVGDLVLKWDRANESKGKHLKFQTLWFRPFQVAEKLEADTYR
jgi:hypothetical protein